MFSTYTYTYLSRKRHAYCTQIDKRTINKHRVSGHIDLCSDSEVISRASSP